MANKKVNIPEGWALVPVNPTNKQFMAAEKTGFHSYTGTFCLDPFAVYEAMIKAAPKYKQARQP
jgi:hypothetical protein